VLLTRCEPIWEIHSGSSLGQRRMRQILSKTDLSFALPRLQISALLNWLTSRNPQTQCPFSLWRFFCSRLLKFLWCFPQGLTFTALLCNAWLPSSSPFLSNSPSEALANLAYTLPAVLDDPDLASDTPVVVQKLTSILTKGDERTRCILLPCLVGCREKLSSDTWQYVAGLAVSQSIGRNQDTR
jgi:hypothetical protein